MYRNFKITEEEKQQILESHKKHGYKKPLNEDEYMGDDTNDGSEQDMGSSDDLVVEDHIYIPVEKFVVYVTYKEDDGSEEVAVGVSRDDEGNPIFDVNEAMMPEGANPEDFINAIKQKMGDDPFRTLNYNGAVLNYKTGKTDNY